ncbi:MULTISPECIES: capsule assembly Wzi family protein [unclassified Psychrobacter]|uniref:capsule assembly Wzi family protein n=1 Tax=unclassified Psychrobacter TaxID=196806 RepID=UPI0025B5C274|nr:MULTISPECIES: capsule assembly Wzi family protein [unclassified Psychrobacter]MDN3454266.1 capsule assembly Wzi family protein [Psychrobacter sp. APC 3350]MDN3503629.1 capsule assembly Wzi family protein [Psychrobacter sp. 5A.1]
MNKKLLTVLSASIVAIVPMLTTTASAQNLYMNDLRLKADIDWLNTQGVTQISTSTWPLSANEIERGLQGAQLTTAAQQQVVQSIQTRLSQDRDSLVKASGKLSLQTDRQQLPQHFGDANLAEQQVSVAVGLSEANWEFNLQANLKNNELIDDDSDVSFEGSYIAGMAANQWLIAGKIPAWWGPGHDGSLIRGDASIPVTGFTMQRDTQTAPNYKYLNWVGPWQYQLFAGQLDDYEAVPDAKLFGARLAASPLPWLEVGASRTFMWGGEGRPDSIGSFGDAVLGTKDNGGREGGDPANQLGGFDAKVQLASLINVPASVYGQYIGEDEAGGLPAKNMYLAGVDYASAAMGKPYQLYAEYTDTRTSGEVRGVSYDHSNYTDGYYQQGYPLGYALGGDAESVAVGGRLWLDGRNFIHAKLQHAKVNQSGELDRRTGEADNQAFPTTDKLTAIDVSWEHQLQPLTKVTTRLWAVDSDNHSSDIGAGIGIELATY